MLCVFCFVYYGPVVISKYWDQNNVLVVQHFYWEATAPVATWWDRCL